MCSTLQFKGYRYSDLKSLSENQYQRLLEARFKIRQGSTEQNQHSEQCTS